MITTIHCLYALFEEVSRRGGNRGACSAESGGRACCAGVDGRADTAPSRPTPADRYESVLHQINITYNGLP